LWVALTMNETSKKPRRAGLTGTGVRLPPAKPGGAARAPGRNRADPELQRKMEFRQRAESGANHARHHVARKNQG
jgi:hypothetical protein